jgi:FkbM family methyltransferase
VTQNADAELPHRFIGVGSYGGKHIPERTYERLDSAICYCFGAGEDISFDVALARDGHRVFTFDPTPRAKVHFESLMQSTQAGLPFGIGSSTTSFYEIDPETARRMAFHPIGLWDCDEIQKFYIPKNAAHVSHSILNLQRTDGYFEAPCKTLKSIMADLGHDHIDLLKMDIEGAEYAALTRMMADGIRPAILNIEYDEGHSPLDEGAHNRILDSVRRLATFGYALTKRASWDLTFLRLDLLNEAV